MTVFFCKLLHRRRDDASAPSEWLLLKYPIGYNQKYVNTLLRSSDFDKWLSNQADQEAKARILISEIASQSAKAFPRCVFMRERGIAFITRELDRPFMSCWLVGQKARKQETLPKRKEWPGYLRKRDPEEEP